MNGDHKIQLTISDSVYRSLRQDLMIKRLCDTSGGLLVELAMKITNAVKNNTDAELRFKREVEDGLLP